MGPWPPTDLFAVANWRAWDTAAPLRCAEVKLCFLSPCVGFLKGFVERPTFTVSQSWPALPPKLDMVSLQCAVSGCWSVIPCGVRTQRGEKFVQQRDATSDALIRYSICASRRVKIAIDAHSSMSPVDLWAIRARPNQDSFQGLLYVLLYVGTALAPGLKQTS